MKILSIASILPLFLIARTTEAQVADARPILSAAFLEGDVKVSDRAVGADDILLLVPNLKSADPQTPAKAQLASEDPQTLAKAQFAFAAFLRDHTAVNPAPGRAGSITRIIEKMELIRLMSSGQIDTTVKTILAHRTSEFFETLPGAIIKARVSVSLEPDSSLRQVWDQHLDALDAAILKLKVPSRIGSFQMGMSPEKVILVYKLPMPDFNAGCIALKQKLGAMFPDAKAKFERTPKSRIWTSTDGHTISAVYVGRDSTSVTVIVDGQTSTSKIPVAELSDADMAWVAKQPVFSNGP
jgi:hypothetical protein